MARLDKFRPRSVLIDALVITIGVVGANWIIASSDPGWIQLNPSPYLLLPILIGARYGFTPGVVAGIAAGLIVAIQHAYVGSISLRSSLAESVYLHTSFLFFGGIAGELYGWLHRERTQSEVQLDKLQTSAKHMDAELRYLRTMKDDYDQAVAASGGQISTLDTELRRLHTYSAEDLPDAVLQLLKRQIRVADAAIYTPIDDTPLLMRQSLLGDDAHLPEEFSPQQSQVVQLAIEHKSLVTLPQLLQRTEPPEKENILLALPLKTSGNQPLAYLLITGIPFISFTQQTADLIALIGNWAGELLELSDGAGNNYRIVQGHQTQRIYFYPHFSHVVRLAYSAYSHHHLSSTIVIFTPPDGSAMTQENFEQTLLKAVRSGDFATTLNQPSPNLAVLLPLVGQRGTEIFITRCRMFFAENNVSPNAELQVRTIQFSQQKNLPQLLQTLE